MKYKLQYNIGEPLILEANNENDARFKGWKLICNAYPKWIKINLLSIIKL